MRMTTKNYFLLMGLAIGLLVVYTIHMDLYPTLMHRPKTPIRFLTDCLSWRQKVMDPIDLAKILSSPMVNGSLLEPALSACLNAEVRALTPYIPRWGRDGNFLVPNVVHYIRFGDDYPFRMEHYLSILSVDRILKPEFIFIIGELTENEYSDMAIRDVHNLFLVQTRRPRRIHGKKIMYIQHASDIVRLRTIHEYGGIYMDNEVIVVKSFDPMRRFPFTLGNQSRHYLSNGVLLGQRHALFAKVWLETYRMFNPEDWSGHSIRKPTELAVEFSKLLHVEPDLQLPNYMMNKKFYLENVDWSHSYSLHMFSKKGRSASHFPTTIQGLLKFDCAAGQAMRFVYSLRNNTDSQIPNSISWVSP